MKEVPHTPQELSKQVLRMIRSVILSYFCYRFPGESIVAGTEINKNAFAELRSDPIAPLYGGEEGVLRGVVNCNWRAPEPLQRLFGNSFLLSGALVLFCFSICALRQAIGKGLLPGATVPCGKRAIILLPLPLSLLPCLSRQSALQCQPHTEPHTRCPRRRPGRSCPSAWSWP